MFLVVSYALMILAAHPTLADSTRSECGISNSIEQKPEFTSSCVFSQRQGFVTLRIEGGDYFELTPFGDTPGNYRDQDGNAVYRRRGLGEDGLIFKMPNTYLFVFWSPSQLDCDSTALTPPGQFNLRHNKLGFFLEASTGSSINQLLIQPSGLTLGDTALITELDGTAYTAQLGDLDASGWPEVYVYISSAGSGSYGSLVAYAVNGGKSISPIYLPPIADTSEAFKGYMGHDEFSLVENRLSRRFPIYLNHDTNSNPSGGMRQIEYELVAGEAGWILEIDRITEY